MSFEICDINYVGLVSTVQFPGLKVTTFAASDIFEIIALKTAGRQKSVLAHPF